MSDFDSNPFADPDLNNPFKVRREGERRRQEWTSRRVSAEQPLVARRVAPEWGGAAAAVAERLVQGWLTYLQSLPSTVGAASCPAPLSSILSRDTGISPGLIFGLPRKPHLGSCSSLPFSEEAAAVWLY